MADQGVAFEVAEASARSYGGLGGGGRLPTKLDARTQTAGPERVGRFHLPAENVVQLRA